MIDYSKPIALDMNGEKRPAKVVVKLEDSSMIKTWLIQDCQYEDYYFANEDGTVGADYTFANVECEKVVNVPQSEVWVVLWRHEGDIRANVFFRKPPPADKFEGFIKTVKVYEE